MAINTRDQAIQGMRNMQPLIKTGIGMAAVGAGMRGYTPWYVGSVPSASTPNSVGINGAALTPASANVEGRIPRVNPVGGASAYIAKLGGLASQAGVLWVIDRMWHNSGLSVTSTTAQAISPVAIPARDNAGTANGDKVLAAIEWSATGGAGTPTVQLTYTDESGNAGSVGSMVGVTAPPVGTFEIFSLAAGDTGVRAPTSLIQSATRTSGTMHLVLFRVIAALPCLANLPTAMDVLTGGRPQVLDDSIQQLVWFPSVTTAWNFTGDITEAHG